MYVGTRPAMRGSLHLAAFFFSILAGMELAMVARQPLSQLAAIVYTVSLMGVFGFSALYHKPRWGEMARAWFRRLDHAWIFVMIAGSATPVLLLGVPGSFGRHLLIFFWVAATIGAAKCFFWPTAPKILNVILYVGLGCSAVPFLPEFGAALGFSRVAFLMIGGAIYCAGAVIYYLKKPNPFPKTFGYHEVFHALVVIASAFHFKVIFDLVSAY